MLRLEAMIEEDMSMLQGKLDRLMRAMGPERSVAISRMGTGEWGCRASVHPQVLRGGREEPQAAHDV